MLEQLFGSKTRVNLLRLFLNNPDQPYYLRELARQLKSQLNSVRREVDNLVKLGIIKTIEINEEELKLTEKKSKTKKKKPKKRGSKKYLVADTTFILYPELKALLLKAQLLLERNFVSRIEKMPRLKLFVLTGAFVGVEGTSTDILLVGTVNKKDLTKIIKNFEKELGHDINYTVMTQQEYKYRYDITDRFLYDILEGKKIIIVDKINEA